MVGKKCCTNNTICLQGYSGPLCLGCDYNSGYIGTDGNCKQCSFLLSVLFFVGYAVYGVFLAILTTVTIEDLIRYVQANRVLRTVF